MKRIAVLLITVFIMSSFSIVSAHECQQSSIPNYQMLNGGNPPPDPAPQDPPPKHKKPKKKNPAPAPEPAPAPAPGIFPR